MAKNKLNEKRCKYGLANRFMEIETWEFWELNSIREKTPSVVVVLQHTKTKVKRSIVLSKLLDFFKPVIRR